MATGRCCWKPWWTHSDSVALAIELQTGSEWGKRKDAEEWIANTEPRASFPKTFTSIHCVATYNKNSASTPFSQSPFQIVRRGKQIQGKIVPRRVHVNSHEEHHPEG